MKIRYFLTLIIVVINHLAMACDACKKQQPTITQGITHGTGPQSNWDWVIVSVIAAITLFTLVFSLKYLIKPGEKNADHIKHAVLTD